MQSTATAIHTPAALFMRGAAILRPGMTGQTQRLERGEELFAEGDAAEFFHKVVSGSIRSSKLLSDGRRQIDAFHLPGDIFGLESGTEHRFTAEALEDTTVLAFRRSRLGDLTDDDPAFGEEIMMAMMRGLERAQDHMLLLGRKTAQERIASFLMDMAARLVGGSHVDLPMQRADIADHLGLTIETVSRTLTQLARDGLISFTAGSRSVDLRDLAALRLLQA